MGPGTKERQHAFQLALGKLCAASCASNAVLWQTLHRDRRNKSVFAFSFCFTDPKETAASDDVSKLPSVGVLRFTPAEDLTVNYAIKITHMISCITSSAGIFHCLTSRHK